MKGLCHSTFAVFLSKLNKYNSLLPLLVGNILLWTREEDLWSIFTESWFLVRWENQSTQGKSLRAELRTNKLNPHMMVGRGIKPMPHCWKASTLTTVPTLLFIHLLFNIHLLLNNIFLTNLREEKKYMDVLIWTGIEFLNWQNRDSWAKHFNDSAGKGKKNLIWLV